MAFSGLQSPRWSFSIKVSYSWVQTIFFLTKQSPFSKGFFWSDVFVARLFFLIQPIRSSLSGVVVASLRWFPGSALRVLRITQGNWQHFKMATFRAGKLARKKNRHFQSTAVKSWTENLLDSRKIKSSGSLADAIKCNFSKYDHITPVMMQLHWLPVKERINFKILLTIFKALHGVNPLAH